MVALSNPTLLLAGLVAVAAAAIYGFVAVHLRVRSLNAQPGDHRALLFFALWWACLGANILLAGLLYIGASLGQKDFVLFLTYAHVQRLLLALSLVGLMGYLFYVVTGRDHVWLVGLYYGLYLFVLYFTMQLSQPYDVYEGAWRMDLLYRIDAPDWLSAVNAAALILPPVVASFAYFLVFFRLHPDKDRAQRYRIVLISWAIIVWWTMAVIAGQREQAGNEAFQLVNRFAGLVAAIMVLAAYKPPAWVQRRIEAPASAA